MLKYLRLNDDSKAKQQNNDQYDSLFQVHPMIDTLAENFCSLYEPSAYLDVDEGFVQLETVHNSQSFVHNALDNYNAKIVTIFNSLIGVIVNFDVFTETELEDNSTDSIVTSAESSGG